MSKASKLKQVSDAKLLRNLAHRVESGGCRIITWKVPLFVPENYLVIEYIKVYKKRRSK